MFRLNNRAFEILRAEVQNCGSDSPIGQVERQIVLKRLEKLRMQKGTPISIGELRDLVVDVFPEFSEKAFKAAIKANQPPGVWSKIKWTTVLAVGSMGALWVINLPYPMIRWPIAKTAPILLLPSFMSMDYHYRGAINSVEQADQLINKATSLADIERGVEKIKEGQKHLDNLPVWFLGYYPRSYCSLFSCRWQFTFDEFERARASVARMDAKVFQERNAFAQLNQGKKALNKPKEQHAQAVTAADKEKAIAPWQAALDQLEQIPSETLAGKTAQIQLKAYNRDFENARIGAVIAAAQEFDIEAEKAKHKQPEIGAELWEKAINRLDEVPVTNPRYLEAQKLLATYQSKSGTARNGDRSDKFIEAAKQFAFAAAKAGLNPPHTAPEWQQVESQWSQAIDQLQNVRVADSAYLEAQKLIAKYKTNLGIVQIRQRVEAESQEAIKESKQQIQNLLASPGDGSPESRNRLRSQLQGIVHQLQAVKTGTTAYSEAQQLLQFAQKKLKQS